MVVGLGKKTLHEAAMVSVSITLSCPTVPSFFIFIYFMLSEFNSVCYFSRLTTTLPNGGRHRSSFMKQEKWRQN